MKKTKNDVLSFCIFEDLFCKCGPFHIQVGNGTFKALRKKIREFLPKIERICGTTFILNETEDIARTLLENKYCVYNRFEKYFVVAFALNYTRFEIYSKDSRKELIKWRDNDEHDEIRGIINYDHNENPVAMLLKSLYI